MTRIYFRFEETWGGVFALGGAAIRGVKYLSAVKTQNHSALAKLFTHNKYSSKVMLSKWDGGGATSYITKAGRVIDAWQYYNRPKQGLPTGPLYWEQG